MALKTRLSDDELRRRIAALSRKIEWRAHVLTVQRAARRKLVKMLGDRRRRARGLGVPSHVKQRLRGMAERLRSSGGAPSPQPSPRRGEGAGDAA